MSINHKESIVYNDPKLSPSLKKIAEKVVENERITSEEGLLLYNEASLGFVGALANHVREKKHGKGPSSIQSHRRLQCL